MYPFKVILGIAGTLLFGYMAYVSWQSKYVPDTLLLSSGQSFKSIPATQCHIWDDTGILDGTLYVFHDAARFDVTSIATGKPISVHVLDTREDDAYYWVDGETTGSKGDYASVFKTVGLNLITHMECNPWWFPNGATFIIPSDVKFPRN